MALLTAAMALPKIAFADGLSVSVGDLICSDFDVETTSCFGISRVMRADEERHLEHRSKYLFGGEIIVLDTYRADAVGPERACSIPDYRPSKATPEGAAGARHIQDSYVSWKERMLDADLCREYRRCGDYYLVYPISNDEAEPVARYRVHVFSSDDPIVDTLTLRVRKTGYRDSEAYGCEPVS